MIIPEASLTKPDSEVTREVAVADSPNRSLKRR